MPVDLVRDAAIDVLLRVFERGMYLDRALDKTLRRKQMADRGRRFLTQLVYGTVRHKLLADHVLAGICTQPLKKLPAPIHTILRMAVFQSLFCDQVTHPAMVHTSVDLAKRRGHAGTARLVNAVLRRAPKSLDAVKLPDREADFAAFLSVRYSLPPWLVSLFREEWDDEAAEAMARLAAEQAPIYVRTNTLKSTPEALVERLRKAGVAAVKTTRVPEEVTIAENTPPLRTKCFQDGHFLVQDVASMLPPHLLEPKPGERVLDLCAAPGGKTTHLAQLAGDEAMIVAMDRTDHRLFKVLENADRLGIGGIDVVCGDGMAPPVTGGFQKVLVDAPCSGLGTLRRHPDLKWRLRREDLTELAETQLRLLRSARDLCENGGLIVYSVCTFSQQETQGVTEALLAEGGLTPEDGPEFLDTWKTGRGQYQTPPTGEALDGFYLMRFRKAS